jgi:hypothetical protein
MGSTILFLAFMVFLFKFTTMDKWWLWFFIIVCVLAHFGYELGMMGLIVAIALWKVVKDICRRL